MGGELREEKTGIGEWWEGIVCAMGNEIILNKPEIMIWLVEYLPLISAIRG
jgi:hypothetical protein